MFRRSLPVIAAGQLLAGSASFASGGEEGGSLGEMLITPHTGIFIWTLVTFLLVLFVLSRYAWKPLLGALETREETIRSTIEQAKNDREEAAKLLAEQKELLSESRRERSEALEKGQREAETLKAEILEEARGQREKMMKQTQDQIDAGMRQARSEMRSQIVDLSIQAAEKLMAKNLDDSTQRRLVEDYLAGLERTGDSGSLPS